MNLEALDFPLPDDRVATHPPDQREDAKLLVARPGIDEMAHLCFQDFPDILRSTDVLVFNNSRVLPARFVARKSTGGKVEGLWLAERSPEEGECLLIGNRLKVGQTFETESGALKIQEERQGGRWIVKSPEGLSWRDFLYLSGSPPLPPYIRSRRRALGLPEESPEDTDRYQTIWADKGESVAAPTASLHFDTGVIAALAEKNIASAQLTLEIGPGTFYPVTSRKVQNHTMHAERYEVSLEVRELLAETKGSGGRVVAIGTTVARVLETIADGGPLKGETDLFILPGHEFKGVDALLTNFHTPRSTLLGLVGAFAQHLGAVEGLDWVKSCYGHAIEKEYRFFSYGDCSFWE